MIIGTITLAAAIVAGQQSTTSPDDAARWRAYHERIAAVAAPGPAQVSLSAFLGPLFELAATRGATADLVIEHRAALMALTVYVNGWPVEGFVPEASAWPRAARRTVTLSGRHNLAQHFMVSALIAAASGTPLAQMAGVYKEISDARRGSGFSFADLAADRAGTTFGDLATRTADSARRLSGQVKTPLHEREVMPSINGLVENLPETEFARRFGGVGAPAYNEVVKDIDQRIGGLTIYQ